MAKARERKPPSKRTSDFAPSPADRLRERGARSLADAELLSLATDLDLAIARSLLEASEGIGGLRKRLRSGVALVGWDAETDTRIRAVLELAIRMARSKIIRTPLLNRQSAVASYLQVRYSEPGQEVAGALFLDARGRLIDDKVLFQGTRHRCDINPEPFLRHALLLGAYAIVVFHTHPGGDPEPSAADVVFTKRLAEACEVVGLQLVDHLILGEPGKWASVRRSGSL